MGALEEVRDLAEAVTRRRALRLWDVEITGGSVVRVFVDADGGVDLDTVAEVSEEISRGLDLRDPIDGRYTLEVSSPGLERTLRSPEHFAASVGRNVVVKMHEPIADPAGGASSHRVEGRIAGVDDRELRLVVEQQGRQGTTDIAVPLDQVRSARTIFEWK